MNLTNSFPLHRELLPGGVSGDYNKTEKERTHKYEI